MLHVKHEADDSQEVLKKTDTYPIPATPSTTRSSLVKVPVLSKQHISTFPAKGILNGSVQNTAVRKKHYKTKSNK